MSKLLKYYEQEIPSGLFPDKNARSAPLWADGRNVVFEDFSAKAGLGQYGMFYPNVSGAITGIRATIQDGKFTVYYGTASKLLKWTRLDGVTDLTPSGGFSGTNNDLWAFARWGQWVIASNGVDPLHVDRDDGQGFVELPTPFDWAKIIYSTDTQLVAMNTSTGGEYIEWSDLDDIENWDATASNFAGNIPQRNLDSEILCAARLGSNIAVYTANELIGMSFTGAPYVFSTRPLQEGFGVSSKAGVAVVGNKHYGFGRRGIWVSDGANMQRIDSPAIHHFVYGDSEFAVNLDYAHLVVAWHDRLQQSVTFYYPPVGSTRNTIGVSYCYANKTWTIYNFGRSFVDDTGVFPYAITGDFQGNIYQQSVVGVPPTAASPGILDLGKVSCLIESGFGEAGFGELGFGGTLNVAG